MHELRVPTTNRPQTTSSMTVADIPQADTPASLVEQINSLRMTQRTLLESVSYLESQLTELRRDFEVLRNGVYG